MKVHLMYLYVKGLSYSHVLPEVWKRYVYIIKEEVWKRYRRGMEEVWKNPN
jgi:hypothetical protein